MNEHPDYQFFLEPESEGRTVYALYCPNGKRPRKPEGLGALYARENSPVAWTGASWEYLNGCEKISEQRARALHPSLFQSLEAKILNDA